MTVDIREFIESSLSDDQRVAEGAARTFPGESWTAVQLASSYDARVDDHIARHDPARVFRDVEAKRRLVNRILRYEAKIDGEWDCCHDAEAIGRGACPEINPNEIEALQLLAAPYSDHPDYDPAWSPPVVKFCNWCPLPEYPSARHHPDGRAHHRR